MSAGSRCGALAAVLLWLALPAGAEPRKLTTVVLALDPSMEAQALGDWQALQQAAAKDPRYAYVDPIQRAMPELALRRANAEQARAMHAAAVAALDDLKMGVASEKVDEAIRLFEQSDLTQDLQGLLESIALKAIILQINKKDAGAATEIRRTFTLDPDYRFQSPRINPAFARVIEDLRKKVVAAPRAPLKVAPPGVNALVYVDGRFRGVSPMEVPDLPPGQHFVSLLSPGFAFAQTTAVAGAGQVVDLQLDPSEEGKALRARMENLKAGFRRGAFVEPVNDFGAKAGGDEVLIAVLSTGEKGAQAQVVRVLGSGQHLAATRVLGPGPHASEGVVSAAMALLDEEPPPLAPIPTARDSQVTGLSPQTWGYISMGAGTAAAVGGLLLGISASNQARATRQIPQTDTVAYQKAVGTARTTAILADGLYAAALAGAGVGTWLLISNRRQEISPGPITRGAPIALGVTPLARGGAVLVAGSF